MRVNGQKVGADVPLKSGDVVSYYMTKAQESRKSHTPVYEDENVLVVDKESGVSAEALFTELSEKNSPLYFLHRIDRNTEGLMIFARTEEANGELLACFREHRIEKVYHALVFGKMPKKHDVLTARLLKDEKSVRVRITPCSPRHSEREAHEPQAKLRSEESRSTKSVLITTEYEVLGERGETTLLKVYLHTGKTHQIRAHLAFIGHPLVGDEKYGDSAKNKKFHATRQRLVAKQLTLHTKDALAYLSGKTFTSEKEL